MSKNLQILVLDDEPQITRVIKRLLSTTGHSVVELNDPGKVEEHLLYSDLSLLITDMKMPGLNGLEILKLVKQSIPNLPVIILTGVTDLETAVEATKSGAAEYLTKPINSQKLIEAVNRHALVDKAIPESVQQMIDDQVGTAEEINYGPNKILLDHEIIASDTLPPGFMELSFDDILPGQFIPFQLYIQIYNRHTKRYYLRKICEENTVFTSGLRNILDKKNLASAYIREKDYSHYLEYITAIRSTPKFNMYKVAHKKKAGALQ